MSTWWETPAPSCRYSGSGWDTVAVGATDEDLKDVWCFPTGEVWTVGDSYSVGGTTYYTILHSTDNGTNWVDGDGGITSGAGPEGYLGQRFEQRLYSWRQREDPAVQRICLERPDDSAGPRLCGVVWGSSDNDVWAVGDRYGSSTRYYTLLHTTNGGTNWTNYSMTSGRTSTAYGAQTSSTSGPWATEGPSSTTTALRGAVAPGPSQAGRPM